MNSEEYSSLDRIVNVLAAPTEAFDGLGKDRVEHSIWMVPIIILICVKMFSSYMVLSNAVLNQQIVENRILKMQYQVEHGVVSKRYYQSQSAAVERDGVHITAFTYLNEFTNVIFPFFFAALLYWLLAKILDTAQNAYSIILIHYGLTMWIAIAGTVITLLLMLAFTSIAAVPNAAFLFIREYNPAIYSHKFLFDINVFSIWQTVVFGIGLSKLTGKPSIHCIIAVLSLMVVGIVFSAYISLKA